MTFIGAINLIPSLDEYDDFFKIFKYDDLCSEDHNTFEIGVVELDTFNTKSAKFCLCNKCDFNREIFIYPIQEFRNILVDYNYLIFTNVWHANGMSKYLKNVFFHEIRTSVYCVEVNSNFKSNNRTMLEEAAILCSHLITKSSLPPLSLSLYENCQIEVIKSLKRKNGINDINNLKLPNKIKNDLKYNHLYTIKNSSVRVVSFLSNYLLKYNFLVNYLDENKKLYKNFVDFLNLEYKKSLEFVKQYIEKNEEFHVRMLLQNCNRHSISMIDCEAHLKMLYLILKKCKSWGDFINEKYIIQTSRETKVCYSFPTKIVVDETLIYEKEKTPNLIAVVDFVVNRELFGKFKCNSKKNFTSRCLFRHNLRSNEIDFNQRLEVLNVSSIVYVNDLI